MGYHIREIEKQQVGTIEKILEEVAEYQDAMEQGCELMALVELSDIYGALQHVVEKHGKSMDDMAKMAAITRRAFEDGSRQSTPAGVEISTGNYPYTILTKRKINDMLDWLHTNQEELRVDIYRNSTHRELNVNPSAVRVVHIPTGISALCEDSKSVHKNRADALRLLARELYINGIGLE